jgi:hypothetical protein
MLTLIAVIVVAAILTGITALFVRGLLNGCPITWSYAGQVKQLVSVLFTILVNTVFGGQQD